MLPCFDNGGVAFFLVLNVGECSLEALLLLGTRTFVVRLEFAVHLVPILRVRGLVGFEMPIRDVTFDEVEP